MISRGGVVCLMIDDEAWSLGGEGGHCRLFGGVEARVG